MTHKSLKEEKVITARERYFEHVHKGLVTIGNMEQYIDAIEHAVREDCIKELHTYCAHTELPNENDECRECNKIAAKIRRKK